MLCNDTVSLIYFYKKVLTLGRVEYGNNKCADSIFEVRFMISQSNEATPETENDAMSSMQKSEGYVRNLISEMESANFYDICNITTNCCLSIWAKSHSGQSLTKLNLHQSAHNFIIRGFDL